MITKKHLKELADIVYMAQQKAATCTGPGDQDLETVASEIKSFAQRHAPNFDESRWNDYMYKKHACAVPVLAHVRKKIKELEK